MAEALCLKDVYVNYGNWQILKGIDLSLKEGESIAILGPNGAGKTTILKAICGIINIQRGYIKIYNELMCKKNARKLRLLIGYVPQRYNIDYRFPISVRDVVSMGCYGKVGILRKLKAEDYRNIEEALELTGIKQLEDRPIGHLSGGELQKVIIARAIANKPRVMLLDELTSHLDLLSQHDIIEVIESIYIQKKITTILVTHILEHIPQTINRIAIINKGCIISQGSYCKVLEETKKSINIKKSNIIQN